MSRSFTGADLITRAVAPITDYPCTFSAWVNMTSGPNGTVLGVNESAGTARILNYVDTSFQTVALCTTTGNVNAQAVRASLVFGTWFHSLVTFATASDRKAYLNGAGPGTDTANIPVANLDSVRMGNTLIGSLAEIAIWNVILGADEIAALAKGFSPKRFRPASLRFYAPLVRDVYEARNGTAFTVTGGGVTAHPRIF